MVPSCGKAFFVVIARGIPSLIHVGERKIVWLAPSHIKLPGAAESTKRNHIRQARLPYRKILGRILPP